MTKAKKPRAPKTVDRELTIEDAVSEALGELTSLAEEMREAFDNTPESLQNDGVGAARGEAADALENISEPDVPEELRGDKFKVKWAVRVLSPSAMRRQSRSDRRYEAIETLSQVVNRLEEIEDEDNKFSKEVSKEEREAADGLRDEVQAVIDEAEAVEFPGMYG
jgi:hypothetical protein